MSQERLQQLFSFLKEDPNDPFNLYAIALEYLKNQDQKALQYFEKLLEQHPDYIATYYHAAQLYVDLGMNKSAEQTYMTGIEKAKSQQNSLALRELQNAYNQYLFEEED
ncbi:Tfp pilus assembly protein PilF [Catalinimonas alkaloidigena]|uniref:tetratricopeptide repeat protein n=1 Tax=Catalinimonas alkaloidigena TaxID=1075417 RepID=UPI0024060282|nr:tetratricopeptide repeat protein [Catalinimonas alkaloidigena]MDF9797743.1 Tfp pilus assembly protein PilF [Catalinimonas alkaloidigena]